MIYLTNTMKPDPRPGLTAIKLFSCSTQLSTKFQLLIKTKITTKTFPAFSLSDVVFIMLINVKMPTIVGILTFMSRINFVLSWVEHEKGFITLGPDWQTYLCMYTKIWKKILLFNYYLILFTKTTFTQNYTISHIFELFACCVTLHGFGPSADFILNWGILSVSNSLDPD